MIPRDARFIGFEVTEYALEGAGVIGGEMAFFELRADAIEVGIGVSGAHFVYAMLDVDFEG